MTNEKRSDVTANVGPIRALKHPVESAPKAAQQRWPGVEAKGAASRLVRPNTLWLIGDDRASYEHVCWTVLGRVCAKSDSGHKYRSRLPILYANGRDQSRAAGPQYAHGALNQCRLVSAKATDEVCLFRAMYP